MDPSRHLAEYVHEYPVLSKELAYFMLGERLDHGQNRVVYELASDPSLVVKHEYSGDHFQNVIEWEVWRTVKGTKFEKWFAPCVSISANGIFLVQKKVEHTSKAQYPKRIPEFLCDLKYNNFGLLDGQFVCFDYGTVHIEAMKKSFALKTKRAAWTEEK